MALLLGGLWYLLKRNAGNPGGTDVTPTQPATFTPTPLPTPTEEVTPTVEPTFTPTPEPSPTETPTPTEEVTPSPTEEVTPTEEPTPTPTDSPTPIPTESPTPIPTNTVTPVPTKEPTKEPTKVPTNTPTNAPTPTNSPTPTEVVQEQPYKMWVKDGSIEVYAPDASFTQIGTLERGAEVTVIHTNVLNRQVNYISEIKWGNGTAYIQYDALSKTYVEGKWAEPRERKDIADALMAFVNNYRAQNGIRQYESPYVYFDVNNPGLGNRMKEKGVRVAKKCCMEGTANHESGQIGTGIYGSYTSPANATEIAQRLFENWKSSPLHNGDMLFNHESIDCVDVGLMTVVEWYDGSRYQYCAIMSISDVYKGNLPDGLE